MPKQLKKLRTVQLRFSGTELIAEYLEDLVRTGLFGRSPGEAAERLVSQGIDLQIQKKTIKSRQPEGE